MVSVIIMDSSEPNVVQLTFENLYSELKDIPGSELLIKNEWFDLKNIKNRYVCFVESDCLIEPGYFKIQLEKFKEKGNSRTIGIMAASTAICYWDNKIYGYTVGGGVRGVMPNRQPKSSSPFMVEVAYIPGAIIRVSMLKTIMKDVKQLILEDSSLVRLSSVVSLAFWRKSSESFRSGYSVYLNPRACYLTTEEYVNDIGNFSSGVEPETLELFTRESI